MVPNTQFEPAYLVTISNGLLLGREFGGELAMVSIESKEFLAEILFNPFSGYLGSLNGLTS
jgi:hypothetical protein